MKKIYIFCILIFSIIYLSSNVFASSLVSIFTFGGSSDSNAGFSLSVLNLEINDVIKVEVSNDKEIVQTFSEKSDKSYISRRMIFNSSSIPTALYSFKVYKNDEEIDTQKTWIYAGSGNTDNHNGGRLSAKLTSTKYTEGDIAKLEVTLTNVEDLAYEPAYFTIKGNNNVLATGIAEVNSDRHMYTTIIDLPLPSSNFNSLNISASWGQLGYTRAINIPINIGQNIPPSVSESVYHLNILTDGNGSAIGSGLYKLNDRVNIKAVPNSNYIFKRWVLLDNYGVIEEPNRESSIFNMPERNVSIRAEFELKPKNTFNLRLEANSGGEVFGGGYYNEGEKIRIIARSQSGYDFKSWYTNTYLRNISNVEDRETYFIMPDQDITLTASFTKINNIVDSKYKLTVIANEGGSISNNPSGTYEDGSRIGLFAEPSKGYKFKEWLIDYGSLDSVSNKSSTLLMPDKAVNVTATFELEEYQVTIRVENGTSSSGGKFKFNDIVNISANPNNNYLFSKWLVDKGNINLDSYTNNNTKFVMPNSDVTLIGEMKMEKVEYTTEVPQQTTAPVVIKEKPTEPTPVKGVAPLPKTNDSSTSIVFISFLVMSLIAIISLIIIKRMYTY